MTMSSPARRGRPPRSTASSTPRSTRSQQVSSTPQSNANGSQATPRASRRLPNENTVPSSSPLMYQSSSPVRGEQTRMDISSPIRESSLADGETTPRATRTGMRGKINFLVCWINPANVFRLISNPLYVQLKPTAKQQPSGHSL